MGYRTFNCRSKEQGGVGVAAEGIAGGCSLVEESRKLTVVYASRGIYAAIPTKLHSVTTEANTVYNIGSARHVTATVFWVLNFWWCSSSLLLYPRPLDRKLRKFNTEFQSTILQW